MASYQYSYVMQGVSKTFPGGKEILKNITLSFLPDAKIGVLGPNGAGKSTLLKIMAGLDTEIDGRSLGRQGGSRRLPGTGTAVWIPSKTVGENVTDGLGGVKDLLDRFNEISAKFAEPMDDDEMNAVIAEQAELQEQIDAVDGWESGPDHRDCHGRAALPPCQQPCR